MGNLDLWLERTLIAQSFLIWVEMGCEFIISSISIFVFASLDQILWFRSNLNYLPNLRASPCAMCIVIPHYRIKGASDQLSDQGASRLAPGTLQHSAALCSGLQCCIITRDCSSGPGSPPATVTAAAWREASRGAGGCLTPRLAIVRNGERRDTVALSWLSTLPRRGVTRDGEHSHLETSTPPHVTRDTWQPRVTSPRIAAVSSAVMIPAWSGPRKICGCGGGNETTGRVANLMYEGRLLAAPRRWRCSKW